MLNQAKGMTANAPGVQIRLFASSKDGNWQGKHYHEHTNIVYLLEGACIDKRDCLDFERKATDIIFLHAGETHETIFTNWSTRYITLDIGPELLAENEIDEFHLLQSVTRSPDAKFLMLKLYRELLSDDEHTPGSLHMLVLQFAGLSSRMKFPNRPPAWVGIVYEIMMDRWNERISLQELSLATGIHPVHISKYFPRYFCCTLGEYMRKIKVERALSMLKSCESLTNIAYSCGFADQSHFTRTFKQLTGYLPTSYCEI